MSPFTVRPDLHVEEVDGALLVLDPTASKVFELSGAQAEAFRLAADGARHLPAGSTAAMAGLVELGLVTARGWDRRRVLLAGGAAAAAAVVAVALPSPAAAQSAPGNGGPGGGGPMPSTTTTTTTTAPLPLTVPAAPTITSVRYVFPYGFSLSFVNGADGGTPVTRSTVYINGVAQPETGGPSSAIAYADPGDQLQVTVTNAIGESPRSPVVVAPNAD